MDLSKLNDILGVLGFVLTLYVAYQQLQIKKNLVNNDIHKVNAKKLAEFIKLLSGAMSVTDFKIEEIKAFLQVFEDYNVSWWHFKAKKHLKGIKNIQNDDFEGKRLIISMHLQYLSNTYRKWWEINP